MVDFNGEDMIVVGLPSILDYKEVGKAKFMVKIIQFSRSKCQQSVIFFQIFDLANFM